jgi:hypothetical protein
MPGVGSHPRDSAAPFATGHCHGQEKHAGKTLPALSKDHRRTPERAAPVLAV